MSPACKYSLLPRTGRAEVARLVREEKLPPQRAIDLAFYLHETRANRKEKNHALSC